MKVLVSPQAFKGSLDALGVAGAMVEGLRRVWPDAEIDVLPVADGGEGTVEALVSATGGRYRSTTVEDPLGRPVSAQWGILGDGSTAVIEMAAASGLPLLRRDERNPMLTSTYGTGQLIRSALDAGARRIVVGIGGSATNDGGLGMAHALGVRFLDAHGKYLSRGGRALQKLASIDMSKLDGRIAKTEVIIASDVNNPLCGPQGASHVYGPQKGATPRQVASLDKALERLGVILSETVGRDVAREPGAGAAGGLGAGLMAFTQATMCRGVDLIFDAMKFDEHLDGASLVMTGEGRIDAQDVYGKAPIVVAERAAQRQIPVVIIVGSIGEGYEATYEHGISAVMSILSRPMTIERAVALTARLIAEASEQAAKLIEVGTRMRQGVDSHGS